MPRRKTSSEEIIFMPAVRKKQKTSPTLIIDPPDKDTLFEMSRRSFEERMRKLVIGQEEIIEPFLEAFDIIYSGLYPDSRPIYSAMLSGPSGVGKTLAVNVFAESLHGKPGAVLNIDCGAFNHEHEVARIIGAPPGYLGHRETQPMITTAKLNTYTTEGCRVAVILLDEFEKAANSMQRMFLSVLDKGRLQLGDNSTVDMSQTAIFMTTNLGSTRIACEIAGGYGYNSGQPLDIRAAVDNAQKRNILPEFLNRVDKKIIFSPLSLQHAEEIFLLQLRKFNAYTIQKLGARHKFVTCPDVPGVVKILYNPSEAGRSIKKFFDTSLRSAYARLLNTAKQDLEIIIHNGEIKLV